MNSAKTTDRLLIIAIGNSARRDDGLGWALADRLERAAPGRCAFHYCYQLMVEDAALVRDFDTVLFVDASRETLPGGYALRPCRPRPGFEYSTHRQSPESVLYLCEQLYGKRPRASLLLVEGAEWDLAEGLSPAATARLDAAAAGALQWMKDYLITITT